MSRKPEQLLWDRKRRALPRAIHIERIENLVGAGTPDQCAIYCGRVTWMEDKVARLPKKAATRLQFNHPMEPEQCNWHLNWYQHGGASLIVIEVIDHGLFIVPGYAADMVNKFTASSIASFAAMWASLASYLRTGE